VKDRYIKFYIGAIIILFIGLVYSNFLISISQFLLLAIWLFEGNFKQKLENLKNNKAALIFLSIFVSFVIGLLWTQNFKVGINELKLKLPLLILPIIFGSSDKFSVNEIKIILIAFIVVIFSKTLESGFYIIGSNFSPSLANISNNISHIRYSLMINFAFFSIFYLIYLQNELKTKYRILLFGLSIWFFAFLIFIQSLTGLFIFFILLVSIGFYFLFKTSFFLVKLSSIILILLVIIFTSVYLKHQFNNFYTINDLNYHALPQYTQSGNKYTHNKDNFRLENGYHAGYYMCKNELAKEWNKRSSVKFNEKGNNDFVIRYTVIRYMTSLGLPKDSVGVWKLTSQDITNIENGMSNYKFSNTLSLSNRIYKVIWQYHEYKFTKDANNQSITQRYEFLLTSFRIIKKNLLIGVGTGDVKDAFKQQYIDDNSNLKPKNRLRSHNQLVTFVITFGLFLGIWCILALFIPLFLNKKHKEFLPIIFLVIAIFSMLTDNSLETTTSISFFAIFYSLLILMKLKNEKN